MMIPYGYKQTEVGVIPEDWDVDNFKNVGIFFKGAGISMKDTRPTGLPCIMYGDIYVKYDTHFKRCDFRVDISTALKSSKAMQNDLLFTASGETAEEIGKCVSYQGDDDIYIGGDIIAIRPSSEYDSLFLAYVQNSAFLIKQKATLAQGHTVVHINKQNIESLRFVCPPLPEQQRIAEALSDVDGMISSLEKLVAKYKSIKTACLQQMFPQNGETVPRMRLPGFTGAWEQRKLGDMMNVTSVKRIHQSDWTDSGVRFLRARDIVAAAKNEEPDDYLYISKEKYEEYSALSGKVSVSDLLVTGVGTIGVPYLVRNLEPLYFKDGNIIWFQNSDKIDGKFLFYSFSAEQIQGFINESAGIGTVGTYTIESGKKTPISLPNQIEQAKVGEFFQQLDNLITLHQRKLKKIQKIKQGMMQQLLTGKIRLV